MTSVVVAAAVAVAATSEVVVVAATLEAETLVAEDVAVEDHPVVVAVAVDAQGAERNATSANRWGTMQGTAPLNMRDATNATNLAILPGTAPKTSILPLHFQALATTVANLATYRRVAQKVTAKSATPAATLAILLGIAPLRVTVVAAAAAAAVAAVMTANVTTAEKLGTFPVNAPRLAVTQATGRITL